MMIDSAQPDFAEPMKMVPTGDQTIYIVRHGDDNRLFVEFYYRAQPDPELSAVEGRPVFREVPYVRMRVPGDKTTCIDRPVQMEACYGSQRASDPERFPRQWQAFLNKGRQTAVGTPLEQWPVLSVSRIAELHAVGLHTVEQIAELPDASLHALGQGARGFQNQARTFIEQARDGSAMLRISAENDKLRSDLEFLRRQVEDLGTLRKEGKKRARKSDQTDEEETYADH
jgi:hypothetical protein